MFNNIGGKIKALASIFTWIGIIISLIIGLLFIFADSHVVVIGILIIIIGSLMSWISSWLLYGFGDLIENSSIIARKLSPEDFEDEETTTETN